MSDLAGTQAWDDAVARIRSKTPLTEEDVKDILASADAPDASDELKAKIRLLESLGRAPDRSGWQVFVDEMSTVSDVAAKVAPIVALLGAIGAL